MAPPALACLCFFFGKNLILPAGPIITSWFFRCRSCHSDTSSIALDFCSASSDPYHSQVPLYHLIPSSAYPIPNAWFLHSIFHDLSPSSSTIVITPLLASSDACPLHRPIPPINTVVPPPPYPFSPCLLFLANPNLRFPRPFQIKKQKNSNALLSFHNPSIQSQPLKIHIPSPPSYSIRLLVDSSHTRLGTRLGRKMLPKTVPG